MNLKKFLIAFIIILLILFLIIPEPSHKLWHLYKLENINGKNIAHLEHQIIENQTNKIKLDTIIIYVDEAIYSLNTGYYISNKRFENPPDSIYSLKSVNAHNILHTIDFRHTDEDPVNYIRCTFCK